MKKFETFWQVISSSINLLFLMSEYAVLTAKYQLFYNHFCTNGFLQSCDECLQYGLPFKIDYHKKIQNGLPFQIIIRKVVYFEDMNCLKWTTITSL